MEARGSAVPPLSRHALKMQFVIQHTVRSWIDDGFGR